MKQRLEYLDGLKAIAAVLVFHIHFLNAYYCGVYTLDPADFHTRSGLEWWIGATPLNLIYAGKAGARLFLAVSAFLLVWNHRQRSDAAAETVRSVRRRLWVTPLKKYLRLVVPVAVVNTLVVWLMRGGCYRNAQAAALAGSTEFFGVYNRFPPELPAALREALFGCFLFGENRYNGPLWFLQYEMLGCTMLAAVLLIETYLGKRAAGCYRAVVYVLLAAILIRTDYLCMILSAAAAEWCAAEKREPERFARTLPGRILTGKPFCAAAALASLFLLTYPSYGKTAGTIYAFLPPKVLFYYNAALAVLLYALWHLPVLETFGRRRTVSRFCRISYCFYLVHFPVLCTASAAFFVSMYGKCGYVLLTAMTYVLAFLLSVFAAWALERCVDGPMQKLTGRVTEALCR